MNTKFLFIFLSLVPNFIMYANDPDLKNNFKKRLHASHGCWMEYEQYDAFIEPYIQKSLETLPTLKHCFENANSRECSNYINRLLDYYTSMFQQFLIAQNNSFSSTEDSLHQAFITLQRSSNRSLGLQDELKNTKLLINEVHQQFYNTLSLTTKMSITISRFFGLLKY